VGGARLASGRQACKRKNPTDRPPPQRARSVPPRRSSQIQRKVHIRPLDASSSRSAPIGKYRPQHRRAEGG
jgi:hypothetical protein